MGLLSYGYKGLKAGATKLAQKLSGQGKTTGTGAINTTKPGTKLTFKRGEQDKFVKFRDNLYKSAKFDTATKNKLKSKQPLTKINKGKSDIFTPKEPKFSKGGRVGLKFGSRKSNVQKIQETFGPKKKVPNKFKGFSKLPEKVQQKIDAKLAKKV